LNAKRRNDIVLPQKGADHMDEKKEHSVSEYDIDENGGQKKREFTLFVQSDYHLTNSIKQYVNLARRPIGHRKYKMEDWQLQFISSILFYQSTFASPYQTSLKLVTNNYRTIVWILTHCGGWSHGAIISLDASDLYQYLIYSALSYRFKFTPHRRGEKLSPDTDLFQYVKNPGIKIDSPEGSLSVEA